MTEWARAWQAAERLQAEFPEFHVRPVRLRSGPGVEGLWDGRLCSVTGTEAEVRAALAEAAERQQ